MLTLIADAKPDSQLIEQASTFSQAASLVAPANISPAPKLFAEPSPTASSAQLASATQAAARSEPPPAQPPSKPQLGVEDSSFKDSSRLDSPSRLLSDVNIEYPLSANNREGVVTLELLIGLNGYVEIARVIKASPAGFFEAAAIAGFSNARFTPGFMSGLGVKSRLVIEVEFTPTNRGGAVAGPK
jgi:periplasmic protein TonB